MQGFHDHYSRAVNCQIFVRLRSRAHIKKAWTTFYHFKLANRQLNTVDACLVIMMATRKCSGFFFTLQICFLYFLLWLVTNQIPFIKFQILRTIVHLEGVICYTENCFSETKYVLSIILKKN